MKDNVEHTGKAFLGLTLNCCHCHDHKYDPITQEDYFRPPRRLRADRDPPRPRARASPTRARSRSTATGRRTSPITSGMVRVFDEKLDAKTFFYTGGDDAQRRPRQAAVPPGVPAS